MGSASGSSYKNIPFLGLSRMTSVGKKILDSLIAIFSTSCHPLLLARRSPSQWERLTLSDSRGSPSTRCSRSLLSRGSVKRLSPGVYHAGLLLLPAQFLAHTPLFTHGRSCTRSQAVLDEAVDAAARDARHLLAEPGPAQLQHAAVER